MADGGSLQDIAPTLLAMMGLPKPAEMTGRSLVEFKQDGTASQLRTAACE